MNDIKVKYKNKSYTYEKGTTLLDASKDFQDEFEDRIIIGTINGRPCELNTELPEKCTIDFFDSTSELGSKVYESGLVFILVEAFSNVLKSEIEVKYAIDKGIYIYSEKKLTKEDVEKVEEEMRQIVKKDLPITKNLISRVEAINYYKSIGDYDKAEVLRYSVNTNVNLYRLNDTYDYFFSYLPVSTGYIQKFDLTYIDEHCFILRYPSIYYMNKIPVYKHHEKLLIEFKRYDNWSKKLHISNISELNKRVTKGNMTDIVLLSECIYNRELINIAENIYNNKNIKMVLLAGPSSSGKTTTSKKLELFLKGFGLNPISLSVDDYFVDREKTPKLEDGTYDFESLRAIDTEKFNKDIKDLLDGKEIHPCRYNFITGKSERDIDSISLGEKEILIIEGLHALNEDLTYSIPKKNKFKMYLCPLTVLSFDNHNRIRTTDNRLLRRIARDNATRGYNATDTLENWKYVRKGEEMYVFPYQDEADVVFNTSLIYELGILKTYVEPLLFSVEEGNPNYTEAIRLLNLLKNVLPVPTDVVPKDSLLREFIGGGYFN